MPDDIPRDRTTTPDVPDGGGRSMGRRLAQEAGGTGTPGHAGTGAEDATATPGRVTPGSTGGGGYVGGSAMGDEGLGDTEGGLVGGSGGPTGGVGGAGGSPAAGGAASGGITDVPSRGATGGRATP